MTSLASTNVGFIDPGGGDSPHFAPLVAMVPGGVRLEIDGLGLMRDSLEQLVDVEDEAFARAMAIVEAHPGWQAVALLAAPVVLGNPGLLARLREAVRIPLTTAMEASAIAADRLGARRVLLLTPFREELNARIRAYLGGLGLATVSPNRTFDSYRDAQALGSDPVYSLAKEQLEKAGEVDGIYFQGAVLDPLPIVDRMEADFGLPIIASNLAMLWHVVSLAGGAAPVEGHGRLLREWPAL
jgi:maleate isomerase